MEARPQKTLSELEFKDLYIRINDLNTNESSENYVGPDTETRFNPLVKKGYDGFSCLIVPPDFRQNVNMLRTELSKIDREDFAIVHDDIRMRVCRYKTVGHRGHEMWCAIRRFNSEFPDIDKLNLRPEHLNALKGLGRRQGLIMFVGGTGGGKTTSAVALCRYYLKELGGLLYTAEEPVEYYMHGHFSEKAFVIQREIEHEKDWAKVIAQGLRSNPKFVFVGEVRNPRAASQMIRIASSGHLVVCTFHGGSISQGISGLIQVAKGDPELGDMAQYILSECLIAVCYQRIQNGTINMQQLILGDETDRVREYIRQDDMKMLVGEIDDRFTQAKSNTRNAETANANATGNGIRGTGGGFGDSSGATPNSNRPMSSSSSSGNRATPRKKAAPPKKKFLGMF